MAIEKKRLRDLGYHLYSYEYLIAQLLIEINNIRSWLEKELRKSEKIAHGELTEILSKMIQRLEQLRLHNVKEKEHFEKLCNELGYQDVLKYVDIGIGKSLVGIHLDYRLHDVEQKYDLIFKTAKDSKLNENESEK
jgi:ElaB/YqjD/DUF883 family membrane-anchored ribosome-binding protein